MNYISFLTLLLFPFFTFSQTKISGVVKDTGDSLLLGNVLLLSPADSSLIQGAHYDSGKFSIQYRLTKPALLKISSYGFKDKFVSIGADQLGKEIDLGVIKLELNLTEIVGVEIIAKVPLFEKSPEGGLIVNVQKTMLVSSSSVLEVLTKSPNVTVESSSVRVIGKGEALLYLDGKQINFERLSSISVNIVDKIEIITNPSAKYDAEGRAVINIKTIPNYSEGFQAKLYQHSTLAKHFLSTSGFDVSYRKGKVSLDAGYSISLGKDWNLQKQDRVINTSTGIFKASVNQEENTRLTNVSNYRLGVGYKINKKSELSLQYNGFYNLFDLDVAISNDIQYANSDNSELVTDNNGQTKNYNHSISLNYRVETDTLGSEFFIGGQYSKFQNKLFDLIDEEITLNQMVISKALRKNVGQNDVEFVTSQVDYVKKFRAGSNLSLGAKYTYATNRGEVDFFSKPEGTNDFIQFPSFSNDFVYEENIPAVYAQFQASKKKVTYVLGVRGEATMAKGVSRITNTAVIDTNYINLFPNASMAYKVNDKWSLGISYSRRIGRPQYQDLDPFVWYLDSLNSVKGNPFLIPEMTHSFEGIINYKQYGLTLGFNNTENGMKSVYFTGNSGESSLVNQKVNLQEINTFFASLSIPIDYKFWSSYSVVSYTLDQVNDDRPEFNSIKGYPQLYLYTYQGFKVKDWFGIEIQGEFYGTKFDGIIERKATGSLSIGIAKRFFSDALSLRLMANDVLQTYREIGTLNIKNTRIDFNNRYNTTFYRLSLTFNFGKLREVIYRNKSIGEEEQDRINQ